jgi:DNA-binding GntR family transcriptional regulator
MMTFSVAAARVDRTSPVPLYYQLAQHLERAIESGELPRGTQLGNEIMLADQLGLSRPTVRRAIGYLVDRGLLVRKRGVGTQVVQPRVRRPLELTSLYDDLAGGGQEPSTQVLSLDKLPASDAVAHALGLGDGEPVLAVERLRLAHGEPLAVLRNYLPLDLVTLTTEALERTGLYQLMRAAGVRLHLATQTVGARSATAAEARLLGDQRGAPLLTMRRIAYDDSGRAVEFANHYYRASLYSFEFVLSNHP